MTDVIQSSGTEFVTPKCHQFDFCLNVVIQLNRCLWSRICLQIKS